MGGFSLNKYIKEQLQHGYSRQQITAFLVQYGYSRQDIDKAIDRLKNPGFFRRFFYSRRPDDRIVSYIREKEKEGYSMGAIRKSLMQSNVAEARLNEAMSQVQRHHVHHTWDIGDRTFLLIAAAMLFALIGLISFFWISSASPSKLMDYKIEADERSARAGTRLYFANHFINMGTLNKYDIVLEYRMYNLEIGRLILTESETLMVGEPAQAERFLEVPADAEPGRYRLEGRAKYGEDIAVSSFDFWVARDDAAGSCSDSIQNQGETGIDCGGPCAPCQTSPSCSDSIQNQGETGIDCGGPCPPCEATLPDNDAILERVRSLGNYSEDESLRLCNSVNEERPRNECMAAVAKIFSKPMYCDMISTDSAADVCYMNFVQAGDYTVCERISDVYIRKSCESLRQIDAIVKKQANQTST